jgi:predicted O-methyltransferase YrrM
MSVVISEIETTGQTVLPTGESVSIHSNIGHESGRVIRHAIEVAKPRLACEVGLAFGMSTLYILDAMAIHGRGRLIGMDPAQHDHTWRGGGLHNVRRAGFAESYEFREQPSQVVLPQLAAAGTRIQFAFIDGWHTFDHALVDFFFVDQMLDVGGVVVLDDVCYPSLRRLTHFIVTNRDYSVLDFDPTRIPSWRSRVKRGLRRILRILNRLVRESVTPDSRSAALEAIVDRARLIALRKNGDDRRSFKHFVAF